MRRYLCDDVVLPRETVAGMLARSDGLDPQSLGLWRIAAGASDFAGIAGLQPVPDTADIPAAMAGGVEPVIALHPAMWGRGLAAMAINALADHAFDRCGLTRLVAAVDEPNQRSHVLMTRCRFVAGWVAPGPKHRLVLYERLNQADRQSSDFIRFKKY